MERIDNVTPKETLGMASSDPIQLAALGDSRLRASKEQLVDALSGQLTEAQRTVLKLYLEEIDRIERHMVQLDESRRRRWFRTGCHGATE
jgi:hypothetical protein